MSSAPSLLTPAPQIRRVSRRHCALYKLNLLTYLLIISTTITAITTRSAAVTENANSTVCLITQSHTASTV